MVDSRSPQPFGTSDRQFFRGCGMRLVSLPLATQAMRCAAWLLAAHALGWAPLTQSRKIKALIQFIRKAISSLERNSEGLEHTSDRIVIG